MSKAMGLLNKYRTEATIGYFLFVTVIAFGVNYFNPSIGIPLSMVGFSAIIGFVVLGAVAGFFNMILDKAGNGLKIFIKYLINAYVVLVLVSMVTPIADWIRALIPF